MSDNYSPPEPSQVTITKPASGEAIINACCKVKQEIYRLRALIEKHPHEDEQREALCLFDLAYNAFQTLQTHIQSR